MCIRDRFIKYSNDITSKLQEILPTDLKNLKINQSKYSFLMKENGGIYDDLIITRMKDQYMIILNAACKENDLQIIRNKLNDQRIKVLQAAGIYDVTKSIEEQFNSITSKLIDFENNTIIDSFGDIDLSTYDHVEYSKKDGYFSPIAPNDDIAVIKNREKFGKIFILKDSENNLSKVILPIRGYGLWGTLYGYISLSSDLNTIEGLEFYEHKETPGLGGEVDNQKWKNMWVGKKIYGLKNNVQFKVIKGSVDNESQLAMYQVDGLSGATITSRGVTNMIAYWFGENGYRDVLGNLKNLDKI